MDIIFQRKISYWAKRRLRLTFCVALVSPRPLQSLFVVWWVRDLHLLPPPIRIECLVLGSEPSWDRPVAALT